MKEKGYRGWHPVWGALAIGLVAFGLSLQGAPAGDEAVAPRGAVEPTPTLEVPVDETPGVGSAVPSSFASAGPSCTGLSTPAAVFEGDDFIRAARIKSSVAVAGASLPGTALPAGGERQTCYCDNECYTAMNNFDACEMGQCVYDPDTGVGECELQPTPINAMCDTDGQYCTYEICQATEDPDVNTCVALTDDGTATGTALSPCAKVCVGGVREGIWCGDASDCPLGACEPKPNVSCNEGGGATIYDGYCDMTDDTGRCCTIGAGTWPDQCDATQTDASCTGFWVRRSDPDDFCTSADPPFGCPVYSSGVAPAGTSEVTLGPVVPPAKTCAATGNVCDEGSAPTDIKWDCPKVCAGTSTICETSADCTGGAACTHDDNLCGDNPNRCHGDPDPYFVHLGDDYTLANGKYLRLTEFRFRGGVSTPGERMIFYFYDNQTTPKFVGGFAVTFSIAGIRDYVIELDCWPDCQALQLEEARDPPLIIPPEGWVVTQTGYEGGEVFWVSTTSPADVGTNNTDLLWYKTTVPTDTVHRDDYDDGILTDDVLIFELVGESVGDERGNPDGACCDEDDPAACTNELRWDCGFCVNTGAACSWYRDCDFTDECSFVRWQGPRSHEEFMTNLCYGGNDDGLPCADNTECDSNDCRMQGRRCAEKRCSEASPANAGDVCNVDGDCGTGGDCWGPCDAGGCCTTDQGCQVKEKPECPGKICYGGSNAGNTCTDHVDCPGADEACRDAFLGYGTSCIPNCCPQPETGADCACDEAYNECKTSGGEWTGMPCETVDDCEPGETCEARNCAGPTYFQFTTMDPLAAPGYAVFSGDSTDAHYDQLLGDSCTLDYYDLGWYEGFILIDDTPADEFDDCWVVTIDFCCNAPIKTPTWIVMMGECPCAGGAGSWVSPDTDELGDGRYGYGIGCGAEYCCEDGNFAGTYTLGPGTYTWQIYGDLTCEGTIDDCTSDEDCAPGVQCVNNLGPYIGHFTVQGCSLAACCFDRCTEGSPNAGAFCDEATALDDCGDATACRNECEETNRLWCENDDADGPDGSWLGEGALSQPVNTCAFDPCNTGACCRGPGWCDDTANYDTEDECENASTDYVYKGGVTCENDPCPVCAFSGPGYCHADHPDGYMIPIDRQFDLRGADDFEPNGTVISHVCWTSGFYAPGVGECADFPPADRFKAVFYPDDTANPGLPDEANPLTAVLDVVVEAKAMRGGNSRLWDYQGELQLDGSPNPVTVSSSQCYWFELSGEGDGVCVVYWEQGLANEHCVRDGDASYGPEDTNNWDFVFCLDSGMAQDDCGDILGACCYCPTVPGGPGVCEAGQTHTTCLDNGGTWEVAYDCHAVCEDSGIECTYPAGPECEEGEACLESKCPGEPDNNHCENAVVANLNGEDAPNPNVCVNVEEQTTSGTACTSNSDCAATGETCTGRYYEFDNKCATDDFVDLPTDCATSGDLHFDVWYVFTNEGDAEVDVWVSSCEEVANDQMMAAYVVPNGVTDCPGLTTDDEVCCGDDSCGQGGGPSEMPNDEGGGTYCPELVVASGASVLIRVGGWDTVEHTGNPKGAGRVLIAISGEAGGDVNPPAPCTGYPNSARKNRMLSVVDGNPGAEVAVQVELMEIGPVDCYSKHCYDGTTPTENTCETADDCDPGQTCEGDPTNSVGLKWWTSKPRCTDKNGADVTATDPNCTGVSADPSPVENIWRAQLTPEPVCHGGTNNDAACTIDDDCPGGKCGKSIWPIGAPDPADNCVHIADCELMPLATYHLRTTKNPLVGSPVFSTDLTMGTITKPGTKCWADVAGQWTGAQWTDPNQSVDFDDVTAAVFAFQKHPNKPHRTWPEVDGKGPNMNINFTDIQRIVEGFQGKKYPYLHPSECPVTVTPSE